MATSTNRPNRLSPEEITEILEDFALQIDPRLLYKGLRYLLHYYLKHEEDRIIWIAPFLGEYYMLCDALRDNT